MYITMCNKMLQILCIEFLPTVIVVIKPGYS